MGDAVQSIQSLNTDAFEYITATVTVQQSQTANITAFFKHYGAVQASQTANTQAFLSISASVPADQSIQTLLISAVYYDVAIVANIVQQAQSLSSSANTSASIDAIYIDQPKQRMSCEVVNGVFTAQPPIKIMNKYPYRILRKVRNAGRQ